jgi:AcrR family transcriptional regulator
MDAKSLAILDHMQYLSERLSATKTGSARGEKAMQRQAVAAQQRQRILDATERLLAERGGAGTTIERIAKAARVSSITFYDHFAAKEGAFVAAFEQAVEEGRARLAREAPAELPWPEQVREGLRALLAMIIANPERARMSLIETQKGGPALLAHYEALLDDAAAKLREGRRLGAAPAGLPEALEETTAAGLAWLLRERLEADGGEGIEVEEMLPGLLDVALGPYLGAGEARRLTVAEGGGAG